MAHDFHYAGPDGEGIGGLSPGAGAAVGSEYCVHLLPDAEAMGRVLDAAREREAPLLLLTPYFRDAELKRTLPLFRAIPGDADVAVAVNDWGALLALRVLFPRLRLTVGRLLSGQKRCPRIPGSPFLTDRGRAWHGEGIFSSPRARRYLREAFGVSGYHADLLSWGDSPPDLSAEGEGPPSLYLHAPYAIVTVSDACPWIGGKSSALLATCPRTCRNGSVVLAEPSMGKEMIQRGKARFVETSLPPPSSPGSRPGMSAVLYGEVP